MPQSDNRENARTIIESHLRELEALCGAIEGALMRRNWSELDRAIADSRRMMHALQNAMEEGVFARDAQFDDVIMRRLRYVHAIRENQMTRLQQYHDAVGERLRLMARWKSALRSMTKPDPATRLSALNQLS